MDALTTNNQRHITKFAPNACEPVPLRWKVILDYHLAGKKIKEIALLTGYTINSIYRILNHPNVQYVRQQLLNSTQQEFEALFARIVDSVRDDFDSLDPERISDARKDWIKAHGKIFNPDLGKQVINNNITAEDVVLNLLQGQNINASPTQQ